MLRFSQKCHPVAKYICGLLMVLMISMTVTIVVLAIYSNHTSMLYVYVFS